MNLRELGEDRLLASLRPRLSGNSKVVVGAGDDCAVVKSPAGRRLLLLKTDCVVEGVHFKRSASPMAVGWKAMMRPLSDFAAMAGVPEHALVTLIVPARVEVRWVHGLYRGLQKAAALFEVNIVGGETSATPGPVVVSVSVLGSVEKRRLVTRRGGRAGDALFVTGVLGGSIRGHHLKFRPRLREAQWLTREHNIHAMMDLSDGVGADLPRLAQASRVSFSLEERALPRRAGCSIKDALSDGEDYELLFALPEVESGVLTAAWRKQFPKVRLTRIGSLVRLGRAGDSRLNGYVHFK